MAKTMHELIDRAVRDPEFRRELLAAPERVIQAEGYKVDSETVEQIKKAGEVPPEAIDMIIEIERKGEYRAG